MSVIELPKVPAIGSLYLRAVTALVPTGWRGSRIDTPPEAELLVRGVTVDRDRLAAYDRVCGFPLTDLLPPTYPHVMAFPLALRLMTAPDFPFPLVGLVHLANQITVEQPIDAGMALDLSVRAVNLRPHERGRQLDVVATASVEGETVWRGVSTYLYREHATSDGKRRDPGERIAPPAASARWRVDPRIGRAYARVSGDRNPIHTSRIGARLLGFPRSIAHGMWSKARCLAALTNRLPDKYTVDVAFKLPILLPATVAFSATQSGTIQSGTIQSGATQSGATQSGATQAGGTPGWTFALHDARTGKPHLIARAA